MSRSSLRLVAGLVSMLAALGAYTLQPDVLALFSNPKVVAAVIGGLMVVLNFAANWLPSLSGSTAGETPPST